MHNCKNFILLLWCGFCLMSRVSFSKAEAVQGAMFFEPNYYLSHTAILSQKKKSHNLGLRIGFQLVKNNWVFGGAGYLITKPYTVSEFGEIKGAFFLIYPKPAYYTKAASFGNMFGVTGFIGRKITSKHFLLLNIGLEQGSWYLNQCNLLDESGCMQAEKGDKQTWYPTIGLSYEYKLLRSFAIIAGVERALIRRKIKAVKDIHRLKIGIKMYL